jgi:hypothetical protein
MMGGAPAAGTEPLVLERTIPLGGVSGRIDHLALDLVHQRLFVAELGDDSVGVVDLKEGRLLKTLTGFREPQGMGYVPATNELYVANGGDGTVRIFGGDELSFRGQCDLGDDADNVRVTAHPARVIVGYGSGGLAVIDPVSHGLKAKVEFKGHPEGFQILPGSGQAVVNIPDEHEAALFELTTGKPLALWRIDDYRGNFPMAIGESRDEFWLATRNPARLVGMNATTGMRTASLDACGDADDVYVDARRHRIYVSCGSGFIDVWERQEDAYQRIAQLVTSSGARTALFDAELDSFFLAVRASPGRPAAIWVYRLQ